MTEYEWFIRVNGLRIVSPDLHLYWELNGSAMSDEFYYHEANEFELWRRWVERYASPEVKIFWAVDSPKTGKLECAPFLGYDKDFLTYYTWPTEVETGERLNWLSLTIPDKLLTPKRIDKGGFIQQATGWKPSPLQPTVNIEILAKAAGLYYPHPEALV